MGWDERGMYGVRLCDMVKNWKKIDGADCGKDL